MIKQFAAIGLALGLVGSAQAAFFGRNALNQADPTCTVSGATKCTTFYNDTLDITILNDWNIGRGVWNANAGTGSAQAIASAAGLAATSLSGWVLPTPVQYSSIFFEAGGIGGVYSTPALQSKFDGVQNSVYWTDYEHPTITTTAYYFSPDGFGNTNESKSTPLFAAAVLDCDVADASCQSQHAVPVPATIALLGLGLAGIARQRSRRSTGKGAAR
jgi:hypothetical protein